MSKYDTTGITIDEAILIAEMHSDVDTVDEAFARTSRANTSDRPHEEPTPGWDA